MKAAAAALLALCAGNAAGQEARWYTKIDNDVALGTDRWYTSSVRIARVEDGLELAIEQDVYTPEAKRWRPGTDDRAPAGVLLASATLHRWGEGFFQSAELALGVRGPAALGRQATTAIHHLISAPHVDWSRQLDNRFDVQLAFARTQSMSDHLKLHAGATLGNQVDFAHMGFEIRMGSRELASALLRFAPTPPFAPTAAGGRWSAYAGASIRGVARNTLISRNYDPFGADLEPRRAVSRFAVGAAWLARWGSVSLDVAQDAKEFDAQRTPQRFGSLSFHVAF